MLRYVLLVWAALMGATQAEAEVCKDLNGTYRVVRGVLMQSATPGYPRVVGVEEGGVQVGADLFYWSDAQWEILMANLAAHGAYMAYQVQEGRLMATGVVVDDNGICTHFTPWFEVPLTS